MFNAHKYPDPPPPMCKITSRMPLPSVSAVYFVFDESKQLVYVGEAGSLSKRISRGCHKNATTGRFLSWIEFNESERGLAECYYIGVLCPSENKVAGHGKKRHQRVRVAVDVSKTAEEIRRCPHCHGRDGGIGTAYCTDGETRYYKCGSCGERWAYQIKMGSVRFKEVRPGAGSDGGKHRQCKNCHETLGGCGVAYHTSGGRRYYKCPMCGATWNVEFTVSSGVERVQCDERNQPSQLRLFS